MNANLIPLHQKINQRVGHVAVSYKGKLLVWGGYMEYADQDETASYHHATDELFLYETYAETWERKLLKGDIPPRSSGGCAVVVEDTLYFFGGVVKGQLLNDGNTNDFYALNLLNWTWSLLKPLGTPPVPCEKLVGWEHNGKVYFFGGFGPIPDRHVFFQYVIDEETGEAWNNQFFGYNPTANQWEWPYVQGTPPCPRAAHAGDKCGQYMFISGGRLKTVRKNDLFVLDMDTMVWSENLNEHVAHIPAGRSWHSFTFVSPNRALMYGGFSTLNNVLNDCWFVDISTNEEVAAEATTRSHTSRWKVIYKTPHCSQRFRLRRFWHKTVYLEKTGDLICFGGFNRFSNPPPQGLFTLFQIIIHGDDEDHVQDKDLKPDHTEVMLTIHFKPLSLLRLSLNATLKHHKRNQSMWETLPTNLQNLLAKRFSQLYP